MLRSQFRAPLFFLAALLLTPIVASRAADITRQITSPAERPIIRIGGDFQLGDHRRFIELALPLDNALVVFDNSNGGVLDAALQIGRAIKLKEFDTSVAANSECASACAYTWLAGKGRYMEPNAKVGFHAAYKLDTEGKPKTSGSANALIGAYLAGLALSTEAIFYITDPGPEEMRWFTLDEANEAGIFAKPAQVSTAMTETEHEPGDEPDDNLPLPKENLSPEGNLPKPETGSPTGESETSPPPITREQIARILLKDIVMNKVSMEQPAIFDGFVEWAFSRQSQNFDPSKGPAQLMVMTKDIINARLATATDNTIAMVARTELHRLQFFAAQDPRVCIADYFGDGLSPEYERVSARMPTWLRSELIGAAGDLFFTRQPVRQADEVTARQLQARLVKRMERKYHPLAVEAALQPTGTLRESSPRLVCEVAVNFLQTLLSFTDKDIATFMIWKAKTSPSELAPENQPGVGRPKSGPPEKEPANPDEPQYVTRLGVDIQGPTSWEGQTIDADDCKRQCVAKEEMCKAYSFHTQAKKCTLKWFAQSSFQNAQTISGYHPSQAKFIRELPFTVLDGFDYPGASVGTRYGVSLAGCMWACERESRCSAFTYEFGQKQCSLMEWVGQSIPRSGVLSGLHDSRGAVPKRKAYPSFAVLDDLDYPGGDFNLQKGVPFGKCLATCEREPSCVAFSYVVKRKQCWLKNSVGKSVSRSGVTSGLRN